MVHDINYYDMILPRYGMIAAGILRCKGKQWVVHWITKHAGWPVGLTHWVWGSELTWVE